MFGSNENMTSQLLLPISLDAANVIRRARSIAEDKPTALELRGKPLPKLKFVHTPAMRKTQGPFRRNIIERNAPFIGPKKIIADQTLIPPAPFMINKKPIRPMDPLPPVESNLAEEPCDQFTNDLCIEVNDYPMELILGAIRRNKGVISHLLADYKNMKNETGTDFTDEAKRRVSDDDRGFMCSSDIKYARPKKAKATSGNWKFIVNTPEHTQTVRLEKCLNVDGSCSYLTDNFKSRCMQVYNYHRLLTWDKKIGLHMDIFKVPSCCSCHVEGYKATYPPHIPSSPQKHQPDSYPGEEFDDPFEGPNTIDSGRRYNSPAPSPDFDDPADYYSAANNQNLVTKRPYFNSHNEVVETTHHGSIFNKNSVRYKNKHPTPIHHNTEKSSLGDLAYDDQLNSEYYDDHNRPKGHQIHKNQISHNQEGSRHPPGFHGGLTPPIDSYLGTSPGRTRHFGITPDPSRGLRPPRRQPPNRYRDDYDLEINESDPQVQTVLPSSTPAHGQSSHSTSTAHNHLDKDSAKRINYNYHPILDFFASSQSTEIQKRADINMDDDLGGWRPITKPGFTIKGV